MSAQENTLLNEYKRIGIVGLGISNKALIPLLSRDAELTLRTKDPTERADVRFKRVLTGEQMLSDIDEEVLLLSPSVRRERTELYSASLRGVRMTSDFELFFGNVRKPVVAVSGSDGKSTTATFTAGLLSEAGISTSLIGNIGTPMMPSLSSSADMYVAEMSSFMLRYLHPRLYRAAITNITPNHLDWHSSYREYTDAKLGIYENAEGRVAFLGSRESDRYIRELGAYGVATDELSYREARLLYPSMHYVTLKDGYILLDGKRMTDDKSVRGGRNSVRNLMTAMATVAEYITADTVERVANSFKGLAHRCERFAIYHGVEYIDSSIDTTPARCAATLASLDRRVILILGGHTKGLPYDELIPMIRRYSAHTVLTGESIREMREALPDDIICEIAPDFADAVRLAATIAQDGDTVLLSPAATSYDAFSSFEERGDKFKEIVASYYK